MTDSVQVINTFGQLLFIQTLGVDAALTVDFKPPTGYVYELIRFMVCHTDVGAHNLRLRLEDGTSHYEFSLVESLNGGIWGLFLPNANCPKISIDQNYYLRAEADAMGAGKHITINALIRKFGL